MSLSDDQVRRLARLARISIAEDESTAVLERLNRVLALVDEMRAAPTAGVEPMAHALDEHLAAEGRMRADQVTEPDRREAFQAVAPQVEEGLYLVPRVIE